MTLLFEIIIFLILLLTPFFIDALKKRFDAFEIKNVFLVFYGLYVLVPLISIWLYEEARWRPVRFFIIESFKERLDSSTIFTAFLVIVGLLAFYAGYYGARHLNLKFPLPSRNYIAHKKVFFFAILLGFVSAALLAYLIYTVGGFGYVLKGGYHIRPRFIERGYLSIGLPWLGVSSLLLLGVAKYRKGLASYIWAGVFAALLIIISLMIAERRTLVTILLAFFVFLHYTAWKFSAKRVFIIGISLFIFFNLFGIVRNQDYFIAHRNIDSIPEAFFYTLSKGEFQAPFGAMLKIVRAVPQEIPYQFGSTFLSVPSHVIPRFIAQERRESATDMYHKHFFPGAKEQGIGYAFFFLAEPYLNFGFWGIVVYMIALGVVFQIFYQLLKSARGNVFFVLLYAIVIGYIISFIRSDSIWTAEFIKAFLLPISFVLFASAIKNISFHGVRRK